MDNSLARKWRLVVLRGVLAMLFGVAAFVWPAHTLVLLVWMFAIYILVDGGVAMGTGFARTQHASGGWTFLVKGLVSIAAAIITLLWPQAITLAIIFLIAAWAILAGILEMMAAIRLRHEINNEWLLALSGIVSIVLGVFLFLQPMAGSIAILWTIAAYAIIFGVLLIAFGLRLRNQSVSGMRQAI